MSAYCNAPYYSKLSCPHRKGNNHVKCECLTRKSKQTRENEGETRGESKDSKMTARVRLREI